MMWHVYILYSQKDHRLYIGCTSNLASRLNRHFSGGVTSTKSRRPLVLIHSEEFSKKGEAFNRERFLKSLWGGTFKKKVLKKYLQQRNA